MSRQQKILVINGPNINMIGIREPKIYGSESYVTLLEMIENWSRENDIFVKCFQSNHEGAIVDEIQNAYGVFDAIVINPAAYTHTSVAILDALKAVKIPAVEIHISKVDEREKFRQISYAGMYCFKTVIGEGLRGYITALNIAKEKISE